MATPVRKTRAPGKRIRQRLSQQQDWRERRRALLELSEWTAEQAWPLVQEALGDPVDEVRHAAVLVAGRLEIRAAREELLKPRILGSPHPDLRWAAVHALGRLHDARDIIPLTRLLSDEDWLVRNEARKVLSAAVEKLGERQEEAAVDTLIHLLFLENMTLRPLVIRNLCRQGSRALPVLRDSLKEPSPAMLAGVVHVLGLLFDRHSVSRMIELAFHADRRVRCAVAEALGHLGGEDAARCLVRMLSIRQEEVRKAVVGSLKTLGVNAVEPLLEAMQHDACARVRVDCIHLLGTIRSPLALPELKACLRSSYFRVRQATVEALIDYGPELEPELLPLLRVNPPDVDSLVRQVGREKTLEGKRRLISVIGETGNHAAVPFLKKVRQDASDDAGTPLRRAVNRALFQLGCFAWERYCLLAVLGRIGSSKVVDELVPSLQHPSYYVRNRAIRSLAHHATPQVAKLLADVAIKDPRFFVRRTALQTLGGMHEEESLVLRTALRAFRDSAMGVRIEAAQILGRLGNEKAIAPLGRGLVDPVWSVREACELALRNFGPVAGKAVQAHLNDEREYIRYRVARLIGKLGNPEAVDVLRKRLVKEKDSSRVHSALLESLRRLES